MPQLFNQFPGQKLASFSQELTMNSVINEMNSSPAKQLIYHLF